MLVFSPDNPFPLFGSGEASYAEAKAHSAAVDEWLGIPVAAVEAALPLWRDPHERWQAQGPAVFLTPYTELRAWLERIRLPADATVVDLGAGYGRLGFVLHRHFPELSFLGYELVPERVRAGSLALQRFGAEKALLCVADLAHPDFSPLAADAYFLYDYGTKAAIAKTLVDLRHIASQRRIVVVGRGRAVRDQVEREHPWLGEVVAPEHQPYYSIYRSG